MVNKTSTIKRICDSGEAQALESNLVCLKRDPEEGVQKCEADVQMQRTPVSLQAFNYDTLLGFSPSPLLHAAPKNPAHFKKCVR